MMQLANLQFGLGFEQMSKLDTKVRIAQANILSCLNMFIPFYILIHLSEM